VIPRIKEIIGDTPFRLDWMSVYKFRCAKLDHFVHGRVLFVGDSAHVVSPFGARGGNGGIQDVDNLAWKLAAVLDGAPATLLETYDQERCHGSAENILHSSRATNFMTPKSDIEMLFRNETLNLASKHPFARRLINSGRLSQPCTLEGMPLQTGAHPLVGQAIIDMPVDGGWLIEHAQGQFTLLTLDEQDWPNLEGVRILPLRASEHAKHRYGKTGAFLLRPDGHICAQFDTPDVTEIKTALSRAKGVLL